MGEEHLEWSHAMLCFLRIPDLDIRPRSDVQLDFVSLEIGFIPSSYNQSCLNHLHSIFEALPVEPYVYTRCTACLNLVIPDLHT